MTDRRTIKITGEKQRRYAMECVLQSPLGHCVAIGEETRSQEQNRLMWPLIADIQAQVPEAATFAADDMKLRFLHALGQELRFLPELEGAGMFPVGQRSSTLSKAQFTALIELMFAYGAKHGVRWSAKSLDTINSQGGGGLA
jgi:hypothetical protein